MIVLLAWAVFSWALIAQHRAYNSNAFDLGFFDQIIWNTAHGRPFETTFIRYNFLGQHFEPVLLLFAAVYRMRPDVEVLLLAQAAVAAWAAVPLYLGTRRLLASDGAALLVAAAYLLMPHLHGAVLFDFHPEVMGTAAVFAAFALLVAGRPGWALAAIASLFLLKEDAALVGIGFALIFWLRGTRWHALWLAGASLIYLALVVGVLMPAVRGGPGDLQERYGYLGADARGIVAGAIRHPGAIASHLFAPDRLRATAYLLGTMALLPLASRASFAAVPLLAANLLSTHPQQNGLELHYPILPFALLLVAAVLAIDQLAGLPRRPGGAAQKGETGRKWTRMKRGAGGATSVQQSMSRPSFAFIRVHLRPRPSLLSSGPPGLRGERLSVVLAGMMFATAATGWLVGSPLGPRRFDGERYRQTAHTAAVGRVLGEVPANVPVSAQSGLLPHLSQRRHVWEFPRLEDAAYVVVDRKGWRSSQAVDTGYDRVLAALPVLGYCRLGEDDGVMLYARRDSCASP